MDDQASETERSGALVPPERVPPTAIVSSQHSLRDRQLSRGGVEIAGRHRLGRFIDDALDELDRLGDRIGDALGLR